MKTGESDEEDRSRAILLVVLRGLREVIQNQERICSRLERFVRILETGRVSIVQKGEPPLPPQVAGVSASVKFLPDGSLEVDIAGFKPFVLKGQSAALFAILCADTAESDDQFVGWKKYEHILQALGQLQGREMGKVHSLQQAVRRLREALAAKRVPDIVQNRKGFGYRLAVLRKADGISAPSSPDSGDWCQ